MEPVIMRPAQVAKHLKQQGLSLESQAPLWGVTPLMVHHYKTGRTKQPNPEVCMNVYRNILIKGQPVLLHFYETYGDLEQAYNAYMKGK